MGNFPSSCCQNDEELHNMSIPEIIIKSQKSAPDNESNRMQEAIEVEEVIENMRET